VWGPEEVQRRNVEEEPEEDSENWRRSLIKKPGASWGRQGKLGEVAGPHKVQEGSLGRTL
jgi:hypothetical protein